MSGAREAGSFVNFKGAFDIPASHGQFKTTLYTLFKCTNLANHLCAVKTSKQEADRAIYIQSKINIRIKISPCAHLTSYFEYVVELLGPFMAHLNVCFYLNSHPNVSFLYFTLSRRDRLSAN